MIGVCVDLDQGLALIDSPSFQQRVGAQASPHLGTSDDGREANSKTS